LGAGIDPGITNFGIYKEAITLNVTTNNSEISAGSGVGNIIDNDDNVVIDGNIDGMPNVILESMAVGTPVDGYWRGLPGIEALKEESHALA